MNEPSIAALAARLSADFETGKLVWKTGTYKGRLAGRIDAKGYLLVYADGIRLRAHRVVYALFYGEWPKEQIDHINGVKTDNRIKNLRLASNSLNQQNKLRPNGKTVTGSRGVTFTPHSKVNPYRVEIQINGHRHYMGSFPSVEAAEQAYIKAKKVLHAEAVAGRFEQEAS